MTTWVGFFDTFAPTYATEAFAGAGLTWVSERETDAVRSALAGHQPGEVLDAGAGTGRITGVLRSLDWRVTAVDASVGMLAQHARNEPEATRLRGRLGEPLPFADASFDAAVAMRVLKYVDRFDDAIAEMARVVKPGGVVVIELTNPYSAARLGYRGQDVRFVSARRAERALRAAGIRPVGRRAGTRLPHAVWARAASERRARIAIGCERAITRLLGPSGIVGARSVVIVGRRS
jgi:ubiquinone/menaquinone biosynthesis C-methylase UbiE